MNQPEVKTFNATQNDAGKELNQEEIDAVGGIQTDASRATTACDARLEEELKPQRDLHNHTKAINEENEKKENDVVAQKKATNHELRKVVNAKRKEKKDEARRKKSADEEEKKNAMRKENDDADAILKHEASMKQLEKKRLLDLDILEEQNTPQQVKDDAEKWNETRRKDVAYLNRFDWNKPSNKVKRWSKQWCKLTQNVKDRITKLELKREDVPSAEIIQEFAISIANFAKSWDGIE